MTLRPADAPLALGAHHPQKRSKKEPTDRPEQWHLWTVAAQKSEQEDVTERRRQTHEMPMELALVRAHYGEGQDRAASRCRSDECKDYRAAGPRDAHR